jgi:MSHA biogenesis protein MshN
MSLINKMLQDLDQRHALGADAPPGQPPAGTHPVKGVPRQLGTRRQVGSELFWWVMSGLMLIALAWLGWVMWKLGPQSIITDSVPQAQLERAAQRGVDKIALAPLPPPAAVPDAAPSTPSAPLTAPGTDSTVSKAATPAPAPPPTSAPPVTASASLPPPRRTASSEPAPGATPHASNAGSTPTPTDALKLATEIATPIEARRPSARQTARPQTARKETPKPNAAMALADASPRTDAAPAMATVTPAPASAPAAPAPSPPPRIERQNATGPSAAQAQYEQAVTHINQGRVAEGMDELRAALANAPRLEAARQTLVALLLEQKRADDAQALLQEGLAINPAQNSFAMLLARLRVNAGDNAGALAVLQKYAPAAAGNAEYHAFIAAVLQRLNRHAEAVAEYQAALTLPARPSAQAAIWWLGLGISQEALSHKTEAREAFQRARASGTLNADLTAFVDQRLAQLQ